MSQGRIKGHPERTAGGTPPPGDLVIRGITERGEKSRGHGLLPLRPERGNQFEKKAKGKKKFERKKRTWSPKRRARFADLRKKKPKGQRTTGILREKTSKKKGKRKGG